MAEGAAGALAAQVLFEPLAPWLAQLSGTAPPSLESLNRFLLAAATPPLSGGGAPVRFVAATTARIAYEAHIFRTGCVPTRPGNWHDAFNALVWLAFPRAKAALNAAHVQARSPSARGPRRDALTHLDECGVIVTAEDASLLDLLRGFRWKALFWKRRSEVERKLRCFIFGHATCEHLLAPFRGLTGKAVLYAVPPGWHAGSWEGQFADLDARLAADLADGFPARPRDLQPLPLLGIPGVVAGNAKPDYYDDEFQFRPGRRVSDR